jgi:beta-lactamase superfamily II metal-dependent hydrolase
VHASVAALLILVACAAPSVDREALAPAPEVLVPAPEVPAPVPDTPAAPETPAEPDAPAPGRSPAPSGGELVVRVLDVGQGDAMLISHPDVTLLIDTGRFDRSDVVPLLRRHGVESIDVLVVTHPHADHIGQFDRVMEAFPVAEVWWSGAVATTRTFERAVAALEASDARYEEPRGGQTTAVGPLAIEVLHPGSGDSLRGLNDASISLRITYGEFRLVTTGDAERAAEAQMVARWSDRLRADVLLLGHHGSSTSTTATFLDAVSPSVAIYSAGANNRYGHPHAEVVERVLGRGVILFGTDRDGTVTVVTDGITFDVRTER